MMSFFTWVWYSFPSPPPSPSFSSLILNPAFPSPSLSPYPSLHLPPFSPSLSRFPSLLHLSLPISLPPSLLLHFTLQNDLPGPGSYGTPASTLAANTASLSKHGMGGFASKVCIHVHYLYMQVRCISTCIVQGVHVHAHVHIQSIL